jgi:hypothetical protein
VLAGVGIGAARVLAGAPLAFWTGAESRDEYLRRRLPVHSIYQAANRELGPGDRLYLVNMRNLGYYLRPEWRGDFVFESYQLQKRLGSSTDPRDLADFFESQGVTHLLIDEQTTYSELGLPPEQRAALRTFLKERAAVLESTGGRTLYRLANKAQQP